MAQNDWQRPKISFVPSLMLLTAFRGVLFWKMQEHNTEIPTLKYEGLSEELSVRIN